MQPTLTPHGLGAFRGTRKRVPDHRYGEYRGSSHGQDNIQIKKDKIQRPDSGLECSRVPNGNLAASATECSKKVLLPGGPHAAYFTGINMRVKVRLWSMRWITQHVPQDDFKPNLGDLNRLAVSRP